MGQVYLRYMHGKNVFGTGLPFHVTLESSFAPISSSLTDNVLYDQQDRVVGEFFDQLLVLEQLETRIRQESGQRPTAQHRLGQKNTRGKWKVTDETTYGRVYFLKTHKDHEALLRTFQSYVNAHKGQ